MEIKELLNEYYTDEPVSQPPYSPREELDEIKRRYAAAKRKKRRIIYAAAASAAAVIMTIGAFAAYNSHRPMKPEPPVNAASAATAAPEKPAQQAALATKRPVPKREVVPKEIPESLPDCTYLPDITMPPLRTADLGESAVKRLTIPDTETASVPEPSFAPAETCEPEKEGIKQERIRIEEKEDVPSGASAYAGEGDGGEADGEMWSEEKYFSYLGIHPLAALRLPSDLKRSAPEEVFVMTDESGTPLNDRRTFTFANEDRTRLATVTTSKSPLSDTPITGEINGVKAAIYDNHMTASAFLEGRICVMIETYGLSEDEINEAARSCAEVLR